MRVEQEYLRTKAARLEHLEKGKEIELWLGFRSLPQRLKDQFRQHQKHNWQENKGIDVDKYLNKLPRDLARAIRKHHFSLNKVSTYVLPSSSHAIILANMIDENYFIKNLRYMNGTLYI